MYVQNSSCFGFHIASCVKLYPNIDNAPVPIQYTLNFPVAVQISPTVPPDSLYYYKTYLLNLLLNFSCHEYV